MPSRRSCGLATRAGQLPVSAEKKTPLRPVGIMCPAASAGIAPTSYGEKVMVGKAPGTMKTNYYAPASILTATGSPFLSRTPLR